MSLIQPVIASEISIKYFFLVEQLSSALQASPNYHFDDSNDSVQTTSSIDNEPLEVPMVVVDDEPIEDVWQ